MKIKALRVAEFGCFDAPVRVENFSGKLDVLTGPNELGKSTLLDALMAVFTEKHSTKSTTSALGRRVPYGGGAPLIEVDFDIGEKSYRLRKQFLSKSMAELTSRGDGNVLARNDEVELNLEELFDSDRGPSAKTGLLWISQGETLQPLELKDDENNVLRALLERDIVDIGGGSKARHISKLIAKDLGTLITPKDGKPKRNGEYWRAIKARDEAAAELEKARTDLTRTEEKRQNLDQAKAELAAKTAPSVTDELVRRLANAEKDHGASREAVFKLQGAQERVDRLTLERDNAKKQGEEFRRSIELLAALLPALEEGGKAREAALVRVESAEQHVSTLDEKAAELRAKRAVLNQAQQTLQNFEVYTTHQRQFKTLGQHIEKSEIEMAALSKVTDELKSLPPVTPEGLRAIESEEREIEQLKSSLDAVITKIRVRYNEGVSGAIRMGGDSLEDGATIDALEPTTLEIEGVGQIEIDPGPLAGLDDVAADLEAHRAVFTELLEGAAVADPAAARAILQKRQDLDLERISIKARLGVVAPDGVDALKAGQAKVKQALDKMKGQADGIPDGESLRSRDEIARDETALQEQDAQLADDFRAAREVQGNAQADLSRLDEKLRNRQRELAALMDYLPEGEAARAARLKEVDQLFDKQKAELNTALQLLQSCKDHVPDGAEKAKLESELDQARGAQENHQPMVQKLQREIAALTATLEYGGEINSPSDLVELETRFERLHARVEKFSADIAAMGLLQSEINRAMTEIRETYIEPVATRIAPYFATVFSGAAFNLDDGFAVENVERSGRQEELGRLSMGTQEQISVLVRLGYARLLGDRNVPMPLILDDALVYSDDERMAALFAALSEAANHHQVIMLTCRAKSFAGLGGQRLEIEAGEF